MKLNEITQDILLISIHYWSVPLISVILTENGIFFGMGRGGKLPASFKTQFHLKGLDRIRPKSNLAHA
jgi:hypothetical protein